MIREPETLKINDKIDVPSNIEVMRTATITEVFEDSVLVKFSDIYGNEFKVINKDELKSCNYIGS